MAELRCADEQFIGQGRDGERIERAIADNAAEWRTKWRLAIMAAAAAFSDGASPVAKRSYSNGAADGPRWPVVSSAGNGAL